MVQLWSLMTPPTISSGDTWPPCGDGLLCASAMMGLYRIIILSQPKLALPVLVAWRCCCSTSTVLQGAALSLGSRIVRLMGSNQQNVGRLWLIKRACLPLIWFVLSQWGIQHKSWKTLLGIQCSGTHFTQTWISLGIAEQSDARFPWWHPLLKLPGAMFPHPFWDLRHVLQAIRTAHPMHPDCYDYFVDPLPTDSWCPYSRFGFLFSGKLWNAGLNRYHGGSCATPFQIWKFSPPWATKLCKMGLLVPSAWTHHFFQASSGVTQVKFVATIFHRRVESGRPFLFVLWSHRNVPTTALESLNAWLTHPADQGGKGL